MAKDYQILKETITKVISTSPVDIGGVYFVLKDIFRDVENKYFLQINSELANEAEGGAEDVEIV